MKDNIITHKSFIYDLNFDVFGFFPLLLLAIQIEALVDSLF